MTAERAPQLDFVPTSGGLITMAVARFGDSDFVIEPHRKITFADADRLSRSLARRLVQMGVTKGTRVAAKYSNTVEWVIVWLAVTRIGGVFMSISSAYTVAETRKCLLIGDAQFYLTPLTIVGKDQREAVDEMLDIPLAAAGEPLMLETLPYLRKVVFTTYGEEPATADVIDTSVVNDAQTLVSEAHLDAMEAQVTPADWMLAVFTSGSTSDPKCVIHTHGAPIRHGTAIADMSEWTQADAIFAGMPFFWVGGSCYTIMPALLAGARVLTQERFEADEALDLMQREGATHAVGWPGIMNQLLTHPTLAERNIPAFVNERWNPAKWWMTGVGMSETAANYTALYVEDRQKPEAAGSSGRPIPFTELRIVDEETGEVLPDGEVGNIQIRSYQLMAGYYKREREDTFEPDGFFDTRDRGFLKDGFLHFVGRDIGLIKTGGNNVSAPEVELALKAREGIDNAFVLGLPDEKLGQIVGAAIVTKDAGLDVEALKTDLRTELSRYKVPSVIRLLGEEQVPYMSNGKMDFRKLAKLIAG